LIDVDKNNKMGRYYNGNINGKFWFGVQCSFPMEKFGATDKEHYEYYCCCCHREDDDEADYCQSCYESKEEHLEAMLEDEIDEEECFTDEEQHSDCEITKENFEEQGLPFLQEHEELWKNKVKYFEDNDDDDYYVCRTEGATDDEIHIIADMCMLKQIQKYFEDNVNVDVCSWVAEN
jgi:hypothetical protein